MQRQKWHYHKKQR